MLHSFKPPANQSINWLISRLNIKSVTSRFLKDATLRWDGAKQTDQTELDKHERQHRWRSQTDA